MKAVLYPMIGLIVTAILFAAFYGFCYGLGWVFEWIINEPEAVSNPPMSGIILIFGLIIIGAFLAVFYTVGKGLVEIWRGK